ncbi:MAG: putative toxin-antitoxin system toxin component, PIN family [Candidatus Bipolaricaulota bacterium]|nr:putative toxin-antitoxin system toxin component, PIN family [Candidatus Bipolaricaulota bacterium]MCS7274420.1 putative toxin-antitoxin system toxin component, PIN family [Candidatus Bipolaricaulota bacterium]MDW8110849.1 putative toxin-antitoxin system toxin component, PIN family [Candidatus Bipolaricaulota bacterium]MDW8328670.1 putative toxin-antitoxin system toxin component, PIN family [Candidatus Bipolaricaulota bacterium]
MAKAKIVLDTSVLVAGFRSRRGAAFRLLSLVGTRRFDIALSVPGVLEYEEALRRIPWLTESDIQDILDYLCSIAIHQEIFFLWRPYLRDPKDDMVLELAVAAGCTAIITYNQRDFAGAEDFGLRVLTPAAFLDELARRERGGIR